MRFALPPSHNFIYACTLFALFHLVQFCSVITATLHFAIHVYCMNIFLTFIVHDFNQFHGFTVHACGIYWKRIFVMMPNLSLLVALWLSLWQTSVPPVKTKWASWQLLVFISRLHLATGFIRCISNKVIGTYFSKEGSTNHIVSQIWTLLSKVMPVYGLYMFPLYRGLVSMVISAAVWAWKMTS